MKRIISIMLNLTLISHCFSAPISTAYSNVTFGNDERVTIADIEECIASFEEECVIYDVHVESYDSQELLGMTQAELDSIYMILQQTFTQTKEYLQQNGSVEITILRQVCPYCPSFLTDYCFGQRNYYGTGTHGYGFLWQNTCTYSAYTSGSSTICFGCFAQWPSPDQHYCLEVHNDCGLGLYGVCMLI